MDDFRGLRKRSTSRFQRREFDTRVMSNFAVSNRSYSVSPETGRLGPQLRSISLACLGLSIGLRKVQF